MNAPLCHQQIRIDPLTVFVARAEARAILWQAGEIDDLPAAVDALQDMAERDGLVAGIGQDAVQTILAGAFHGVRGATGWAAAAAMAWDHPGWGSAAREYHDNRRAHQRVAA
jgi:hypothetical protein